MLMKLVVMTLLVKDHSQDPRATQLHWIACGIFRIQGGNGAMGNGASGDLSGRKRGAMRTERLAREAQKKRNEAQVGRGEAS